MSVCFRAKEAPADKTAVQQNWTEKKNKLSFFLCYIFIQKKVNNKDENREKSTSNKILFINNKTGGDDQELRVTSIQYKVA